MTQIFSVFICEICVPISLTRVNIIFKDSHQIRRCSGLLAAIYAAYTVIMVGCIHECICVLERTRYYWDIENGLHYRRGVTLREDATRIAKPALAKTMATINNYIVGLTQKRESDAKIARQLA